MLQLFGKQLVGRRAGTENKPEGGGQPSAETLNRDAEGVEGGEVWGGVSPYGRGYPPPHPTRGS